MVDKVFTLMAWITGLVTGTTLIGFFNQFIWRLKSIFVTFNNEPYPNYLWFWPVIGIAISIIGYLSYTYAVDKQTESKVTRVTKTDIARDTNVQHSRKQKLEPEPVKEPEPEPEQIDIVFES